VNNRGYTLIELSVVVLLVGMMLLIAVPRVRDTLLNDDLKVVTRRIIGAARELQNESVREQTDYILHMDLNQPAIWSYAADTTAEKRAELRKKAVRLPEGIRIADIRQADGIKKTEGEVAIRFFRRGYTEPTVIHLAKGDRVFTLVFNPFLRTLTVYEKEVDFSFNQVEQDAGT
jgi:prepilin-type N-terminal cleavage/methylation domain-containing protein